MYVHVCVDVRFGRHTHTATKSWMDGWNVQFIEKCGVYMSDTGSFHNRVREGEEFELRPAVCCGT